MTPGLWARLNPLFNAAVKKPSSERNTFVVAACGDDSELRRELLALLASYEQQDSTTDEIAANIRNLAKVAIPSLPVGSLVLDRFKIVRLLGSGGMGDVYEALDLELSEAIALKMIRPEIAGNELIISRFKKEVHLARKVTGPNVCRIHEFLVGKSDGKGQPDTVLTMELLHGVTLADKLKAGPLTWREARAITFDICAGLTTIHNAGIIHRDLKARNIMLADRGGTQRAVLMDFGLAHEVYSPDAEAETGLTMPGMILGTPEYMAPEQFEGKAVSPATDLYAVGIVLYEMLTGKHPFASTNALGTAVLRGKRPRPVSSFKQGVPHRWDSVIARCLEYEAARRYQSADELAEAIRQGNFRSLIHKENQSKLIATVACAAIVLLSTLYIPAFRERLQGVVFASHEKHIAVLPFDVNGNDPASEALSDGLMDSLSGKLSNLKSVNHSLWVVPASEIRNKKVSDASTAWKEFGATIVLKGSMKRSDGTIRLAFALIDSKNMREIGSADVESNSGNLMGLEDEAVTKISRLINVTNAPDLVAGTAQMPPPAVFEKYIEAIGYMGRHDKPGNLDRAIANFNSVISVDKTFTLGYAQMAEAYRLKYQLDKDPKWLSIASDVCAKASGTAGQSPALLVTLAKIHESTAQRDLALQELKQALDLDPTNADAIQAIADEYVHLRRYTEAEATYKKAIALRPDFWDGYEELANFYDTHGRHADAIPVYLHAIQITPDNGELYLNLGGAYIGSGNPKLFPDAERALKKSIELNPQYAAYANLSYLYTIQHRYPEAATAAAKALDLNKNDYQAWSALVTAYEWLGQESKAAEARTQMLALVEQGIKLNPTDGEAQSTLASLTARMGSKEKTMQVIRTALALGPDDPVVLASVADAYEVLGDRKHAIVYTRRALQKGFSLADVSAEPNLQAVIKDPTFGALHNQPN